ncbi:potassium channel family protein [Isoptericola sp. NEAU-Y5]|uniref:Potassium channel family protein n=1 Tax=Isoptericola luteus TaxID=2879484 RepID=A0ABS7ZCE8_9MICO|nr:potassium channel family protein [Isoptericola sp. NEAU-Y5]MCA5892718.1 potassium channel family protein [Isoptericola sp. NEAU-Y5]
MSRDPAGPVGPAVPADPAGTPSSEPPAHPDAARARLRRWQAATERPLTAMALLFLVAYAVPVARPDVSADVRSACTAVLVLTWLVFVVDYVVRVRLAPHPRTYVRRHLLELAVVVLPVLRPLLLISVVARLGRLNALRLRGKVVRFAATGTALLVLVGALTVTQAERGAPGASIDNLGDGFWWVMVTITTVGYGDMAPVTGVGRVIAVGLMLGGIALLGVVTATLASWLVEQVVASPDREVGDDGGGTGASIGGMGDLPASRVQVTLLTAEVQALRAELAAVERRDENRQAGGTTED